MATLGTAPSPVAALRSDPWAGAVASTSVMAPGMLAGDRSDMMGERATTSPKAWKPSTSTPPIGGGTLTKFRYGALFDRTEGSSSPCSAAALFSPILESAPDIEW